MSVPILEELARREYGRLVSVLAARFQDRSLDAIEDAVQSSLTRAIEVWPEDGTPADPSAWLFRVAANALVDGIRSERRRSRLLGGLEPEAVDSDPSTSAFLPSELPDAQLKMLFVCCDARLPMQTQQVLALRVLCGFSVSAIAPRLFMTEANVYKRLSRGRAALRDTPLDNDGLERRGAGVLRVLYALFSEGYASHHPEWVVRAELCDEAIRLAEIVAQHPRTRSPEAAALLSMMLLHRARIDGRQDGAGGLLLLSEQDRSGWSRADIAVGLSWLAKSASGPSFSRYHAEAGIAAEHCLASCYEATRWDRIVACYAALETTTASAQHRLGHALAIAELHGPQAGLEMLERWKPPTWLVGAYPWFAALADLHRRCGHADDAHRYHDLALDTAPTPATAALLARRWASLDGV